MGHISNKDIILIGITGYSLIVLSAIVLSVAVRIFTGYFPSFEFFTLTLITFNLHQLNLGFIIVPVMVSILVMAGIGRFITARKVLGGLSLSSYYIIVSVV